MPIGMFLRSNWTATQIADPNGALTLEAYQDATGDRLPPGSGTAARPVPIETFVRYGQWYQREAVPNLDRRKVTTIEKDTNGFRVLVEDGDEVISRRVVVAVGIGSFAWIPAEFQHLPVELAAHTSKHRDLNKFAGKDVLVIGSGQSALESAALLHEGGVGHTEVIGRARVIHWLGGVASRTLHHGMGKFVKKLLYAPTDVGPAGISQLMARPNLVRKLPRWLQDRLRKRSVRPAGARWLVERLRDVPIKLGAKVVSAEAVGDRVRVKLDDGSERTVDHVLLGTGYKVDVSKYELFSPEIKQSMNRNNGFPILKPGLETSIDGLHILGAPAVWSFGPLMQFVSGARYASAALVRSVQAGSNGKH